ncbi:MAG: metalloregulator ArsR/SmtB family transcription factor [Solobacterium sp.]|jgi:DNA-binding transcriptional ArsR family regulator|nr:metalloregulator ArsR/SmtB family transcription factor [Solobacterium sp.]MCH4204867.1 metalloregulator ArsR/SmtB family transcription factor [Solobacterium sp.]MCH4226491.1 metalloregulator ArsR/SmtB family transcription factor [Solobacterium sp.]MCH4283055.1 metalloregulator ArsR/SmtB family transcription factor [Solobacterium sp.]
MSDKTVIADLAKQFAHSQKILTALGDENRQHLILEMMQMGKCDGVRVGEITARTHLSRPAVSHHLQILKDAGVIKMRREAAKNHYYFDVDTKSINRLMEMLKSIKTIMQSLPDRSGSDDQDPYPAVQPNVINL